MLPGLYILMKQVDVLCFRKEYNKGVMKIQENLTLFRAMDGQTRPYTKEAR